MLGELGSASSFDANFAALGRQGTKFSRNFSADGKHQVAGTAYCN
jgi:hypothetical protein